MTPPVDDISLETGAVTLLVICCCCCCCIGCRFDPSWVGKTTVSPTAKIAGDDSIVIRDIDWGGEGTDDDDSFDAATLIKLFIFQFKIDKVFFFFPLCDIHMLCSWMVYVTVARWMHCVTEWIETYDVESTSKIYHSNIYFVTANIEHKIYLNSDYLLM